MSHSKKLLNYFEKFSNNYPEDEIVQINDEFLSAVEEICDGLLNVEIVYTFLTQNSRMRLILNYSSSIITRFINADIAEPLGVKQFNVFMKISRLTTKLKSLVISELIDDDFMLKNDDGLTMLKHENEQHICDTYKSKLKYFRTNSDELEIYKINEHFTYFLYEYLIMLSKLKSENVLLEKNIKLLLEVADDEMLAKKFHVVSYIFPHTTKLLVLQKITNCFDNPKFNIQSCEFLKSKNKDYKLEMCAVTFFTLQNICEHLKNGKMNQSLQILSKFNVENFIYSIDSPTDLIFEKTFEESTKLITFKRSQNIIQVPYKKIEKYLIVLELLSISLRGHQKQIHNSPFSLVLLSILSEFVMATNLDNPIILKLIKITIGFLKISRLPAHFLAVSFASNIYQKLKSNNELRHKSIDLFESISNKLNEHTLEKQKIIMDLNKCINNDNNWIDKAIIISCFLGNIPKSDLITNTSFIELHYALNEIVILSSKYTSSEKHLLVYPYAVSLNFSIVNKNEDCFFNNLAILDDYISILLNEDMKVRLEDKKFLLNTIYEHYEVVAHCLPKEFLLQCWKFILNPINMNYNISKVLLDLCSSDDLMKFISILKIETIKIIEGNESTINQDYYEYIQELWHFLLNVPLVNQKKTIRKDNINHFCFVLNRTYLFNTKKIQTDQGLILLLKLVCSLLQILWINRTTMMNFSLRIMTFVEKSKSKAPQLLKEASELLIVLYKCPNNFIKPYLGLFVTAFINLLKKCLSSVCPMPIHSSLDKNYYIPFHKLEKCSRLFKQTKSDFYYVCHYIIEDFIKLVLETDPVGVIKRHFFNIIFNLMDICSLEQMRKLMNNIQGSSLMVLKNAYDEYRLNVRFTGRL